MADRTQRSRRLVRPPPAGEDPAPGSVATSPSSTAASSRRSSSLYVSTAMTLAASQNLPAVLNDPKKGKKGNLFSQ